jgi:uncharacterized membrane protein YgcG
VDAYELHEARLIQERTSSSGAGDLQLDGASVPAGKVWTILSARYNPDVAETRTVHFRVVSSRAIAYTVTVPVAIALSTLILMPLVTEGMELKLFPGELLRCMRDAATAGSVMNLYIRLIESDLPFYAYREPLKPVVNQARKHGAVYRSSGGISTGGSGGTPTSGHGAEGGGGGGAEPV